eukprot:GGOE01000604.1.p1 GENE.GGOE01000604.1~~GGOE01000604.1.p1  ORF type:complete len:314 (+),score=86.33 GGOE01000604.1:31-942(+)
MGCGVCTARDARQGQTCPVVELPGCQHSEAFILGAGTRQRLYTQQWLPLHKPKALILLCHGYASHTSWETARVVAAFFVSLGYGVFGIDYIGHGKSGGLQCHIPNWTALCQDVEGHYSEAFLVGSSMGGAVALTIARHLPEFADGLILLAPMCRIAPEILPSKTMLRMIRWLARVFPTWQIIPTGDSLEDKSVRDPECLEYVRQNPFRYTGRPRLATGMALLQATRAIETAAHRIVTPMLLLHGEADCVTAPEASKDLYEKIGSKDKELRLYPDAWHALFLEPDPVRSQLRADVADWLQRRCF